MGGRGGFTLLEFSIVIAIFCLLASLSFGSLYQLQAGLLVKGNAELVAAELRKSQAEGFSRSQTIRWDPPSSLPGNCLLSNPRPVSFAGSGFVLPGSSGTMIVEKHGRSRKVIVSSYGRIRVE